MQKATFVSGGDNSRAHKAELRLWQAAAREPAKASLLIVSVKVRHGTILVFSRRVPRGGEAGMSFYWLQRPVAMRQYIVGRCARSGKSAKGIGDQSV